MRTVNTTMVRPGSKVVCDFSVRVDTSYDRFAGGVSRVRCGKAAKFVFDDYGRACCGRHNNRIGDAMRSAETGLDVSRWRKVYCSDLEIVDKQIGNRTFPVLRAVVRPWLKD